MHNWIKISWKRLMKSQINVIRRSTWYLSLGSLYLSRKHRKSTEVAIVGQQSGIFSIKHSSFRILLLVYYYYCYYYISNFIFLSQSSLLIFYLKESKKNWSSWARENLPSPRPGPVFNQGQRLLDVFLQYKFFWIQILLILNLFYIPLGPSVSIL